MTFYSFLIIFTSVFFITYFVYKKKQKEMFAVLRLDSNAYENGLPITNPYREIIKEPMPKKRAVDWDQHLMYGYSFIPPKYWRDDREPICHIQGPEPAPVFDKGTPDNALFYQRPIKMPKQVDIQKVLVPPEPIKIKVPNNQKNENPLFKK